MAKVGNSLNGNLSVRTLSIYRLDSTGTVPVEPIIDLITGKSVNRITADLIESEQYNQSYQVTTNSISNSALITSHVNKNLKTLSVSVFFVPNPSTGATAVLDPTSVRAPTQRLDQQRIRNIQALADAGIPVGVYTPRWALPRAFITDISAPWDPEVGVNSRLSLSFLEARVVSPITGVWTNDYDAQLPGNNSTTGGGQSAASTAKNSGISLGTTGNAPIVNPPLFFG